MNTLFGQMGIFSVAIVLMIFFQMKEERKKYRDCLLFSRLLLAMISVLLVDTIGWLIDGNPIGGQIWITTLIDGLDLLFTTGVGWCWVQYTMFIIDEKKQMNRKWYQDFSTWLLILQLVLVCCSQWVDFYYYVDASGVYHRGEGYILHVLISMAILVYSFGSCMISYRKETEQKKKSELLFVALIILIPSAGNIFQLFVYGYPTVWLCMVFMVFAVYIHIQNKRVNEERVTRNDALKAALAEAQSANIAKTEFFSRMSHDMRTPMNGILGLANLSLDEKNPEVLLENVGKIKASGEYMLGLINDTLDFQKIESGRMVLEPQVIVSKDLLVSICSMVQETAREKGVNFKISNKNAKLEKYIKIDPMRTKQIFVNLLSNAIKFTPAGGTVELGIEVTKKEGNFSHNLITVTDTGIGMSSEFLKDGIFEPFSQEFNEVTEKNSGTGLGLSIAKQLIELMGGSISVESEQGSGTTFEVRLCFERVEEQLVEKTTEIYTEKRMLAEQKLKGKCILLAEDHPLNAEITKRLLQKMECEIVWTKNGKECVDCFAQSKDKQFDAILMDIRMPVMDGLEATREIRALERLDAKNVPIIAMTANAYESDKNMSFEAGMNAHLAKPIDPQLMYQTIAQYLG